MNSSVASGLVLLVFASAVLIYGAVLYRGLARLRDQNNLLRVKLDDLLKQRYEQVLELLALTRNDLPAESQQLLSNANDACASAAGIREKADADLQLTASLQTVFESANHNSRLASSKIYVNLRNLLISLQSQIADHRALFNEDIRAYNARVGQVPDALVASIMGMRRRQRFEVSRKS